ncbi:DMT family transporter [Geodermatophilus chilensis]|uniref:DMT family transporter n=1 Tax=Geodermatophilus chilensis TaxID=2035835 RepID=UPI000C261A04|nr:DMT family transporter [Geodermatophilus chilensis]
MTAPGRSVVQRIGVPALFVLLWSTGFIGAKYGLPYAEPLTFLGVRLAAAAGLLALAALALRGTGMPRPASYGHAAVAGVLLHAGYLGGVFVAISLGTPAGVAAVVVSLQPVLTALLARRVLGERAVLRQWLGSAIGVAGVVMVVGPGIATATGADRPLSVPGLLACLVALASGTAGTVYQKRHGDDTPLVWGTAVQYAAAAALLLVGAAGTEDMVIRWTGDFVLALVWLVLVLSLGAVLLLFLLLRRGTASGVSGLLYLVPPAVAVEAFLLFGETLPRLSLAGIGVTALGVALVVLPPRQPARPRV